MSAAIKLHKASYSYKKGGFRLLPSDFCASYGEITAIAGPNGSGKSTLLKLCAGLLRPQAGSVFIGGETGAPVAKRVSYIPQEEEHSFNFTLFEVVAMGRRPHGSPAGLLTERDREIIENSLEYFGLSEKRGRVYHTLSGGEKRSALAARALCQEAGIIMMDEPAAYLDIHNQLLLMDRLARLKAEGKCVVFISHDLNMCSEFSDQMLLMKEGAIEYSGNTAGAFGNEVIRRVFNERRIKPGKNPFTGNPAVYISEKMEEIK